MLQKFLLVAITSFSLGTAIAPAVLIIAPQRALATDAPASPTRTPHRGSGRLDAEEIVECPTGTVYRGGSAEPCQALKQADVCSHISRLGRCNDLAKEEGGYIPPVDIGGPNDSQSAGTRNK